MRVKMHTAMAGPKATAGAGQVVEVDDATGAEWINHGYASEVAAKAANTDKAAPAETADQAPAETATAAPQRRKK